jgi:formyltetrahydrofolate synthetase
MQPILEIAKNLKLSEEHVELFGRDKAKISLDALERART